VIKPHSSSPENTRNMCDTAKQDLIGILSNAAAVADVDFHSVSSFVLPPANKRRKSDDYGLEQQVERPDAVKKQSSLPEMSRSRFSSDLDNMARDLFARHQQRRKTFGEVLGITLPAPSFKNDSGTMSSSGSLSKAHSNSQLSPEMVLSVSGVLSKESTKSFNPLECRSMPSALAPHLKQDEDAPAKKRRSWKKPKDKPKRPLSAYNLFFQKEREAIVGSQKSKQEGKRRHRKAHGKIGFADLAKTIAEKWKNLDEESKAVYEEKASVEKARYKRELDIWIKKREMKKDLEKTEKRQREIKDDGKVDQSGSKDETSPTFDRMWLNLSTDTVSELVNLVHNLPGDSPKVSERRASTEVPETSALLDGSSCDDEKTTQAASSKRAIEEKKSDAQFMEALKDDILEEDDFADLMAMPLPLD